MFIKNMSILVFNIPWSIEFYENIFSLLQGNFFKVFAHQNLEKSSKIKTSLNLRNNPNYFFLIYLTILPECPILLLPD